MVAVNLLASLLTTNNLYCTSISSSIIAVYYNGESREIWYAITMVVHCRLSYMRSPLSKDVGYLLPCSYAINWIVPFFPQIEHLFSYVTCSFDPSKFCLFLIVPKINALFTLFNKTPWRASYASD